MDDIQDDDGVISPKVPLLNTISRQVISETVVHFVKDDEAQYKSIWILLATLVPYEPAEEGKMQHFIEV